MAEVITIVTNDGGRFSVAPDVTYGPFAVHRMPDARSLWTVTHIRTGLAAEAAIGSRAEAVRLARMLARCGANWNIADETKLSKRSKEIARATRDRWRWSIR